MDDGTNYWALFAILFPLGLFLFVCGLLLYRKKFVGLVVLDGFLPGKPSVASTYLGVWLMCLSVAHFVTESENPFLVFPFGAVMFGAQAIGMIGFLWMPKFLQPKWMKQTDRRISRGQSRYRQFLKEGGQS